MIHSVGGGGKSEIYRSAQTGANAIVWRQDFLSSSEICFAFRPFNWLDEVHPHSLGLSPSFKINHIYKMPPQQHPDEGLLETWALYPSQVDTENSPTLLEVFDSFYLYFYVATMCILFPLTSYLDKGLEFFSSLLFPGLD